MDLGGLDVARPVLYPGAVGRLLCIVCVLALAPASARAQPAGAPAPVERANATVGASEERVVRLSAQRTQAAARYQQQLTTIDRLKQQKASWRRDRALNTAQANANDTAQQLTRLDQQLAGAQQAVLTARRAAVRAVDAELASGASGARAEQLARLRARLAPPAPTPKKIVIPDAAIDPLADPQELEQQAAALAEVERQLDAQRKSLDAQHQELALVAELRQAHDRAGELSTRDDDQPQRGGARALSGSPDGAGAAQGAGQESSDSRGPATGGGGATFETSAAIALGEVIDRSTIDGLVRASRTGDPRRRADAARLARDAVARRLELLRQQRSLIEARVRQLRGR